MGRKPQFWVTEPKRKLKEPQIIGFEPKWNSKRPKRIISVPKTTDGINEVANIDTSIFNSHLFSEKI